MSGGAVTPLLGALAVALLVASVLLGVSALSPAPTTTTRPAGRLSARQQRVLKQLTMSPSEGTTAARAGRRRTMLRVTGFVAGLVTLLVTRWPVAAVLAHLAVVYLPRVLGGTQESAAAMERLQGLADWTRRLADLISSGAAGSTREAMRRSLAAAPDVIAPAVLNLVTRMGPQGTEAALRQFARELDDPAAEKIAMVLILRERNGGPGLAEVLTALAEDLDGRTRMVREVEAERAKPRANMRTIVTVTFLLIAGMVAFARPFLSGYSTPVGQVGLLVVAAVFGVSLRWMRRLADPVRPPRVLLDPDAGGPG